MESTQVIYNILQYYLVFCLATSISIVYMSAKILKLADAPYNLSGKATYCGVMALISFVLAPIFFIVFIFYSQTYIENAARILRKQFKQDEESS